MVIRQDGLLDGLRFFLVESIPEDRFDAAVAEGVEVQGALAGGIKPLVAVGFAESHDAQAGAEGLLRMPA